MEKDCQNVQIAQFALSKKFEDIGIANVEQLKRHLLDALGSLAHAATRPAIQKFIRQFEMLGESGKCIVPLDGKLPFDRAAQLYTAMIRYPDFMDNFLGKEATCHPSDNIGSLLAASQYKSTSGKDFLTAMAVAYEIESRLALEIPVMKEGIDHTLMLSYSIIASVSRMFGLTVEQTAHALGIGGCSTSPLVTSRASYTYEWKGFASSLDALTGLNTVLLAKQGMTGPIELFEGPKGFGEIFGMKLNYDWSKDQFELIRKCVLKSYNAEVHTQSAIEAMLEIRNNRSFPVEEIEEIIVTTFLTAYHITGSGSYGNRKDVETKEQADHSLFYVIAVAALDGEVYPEQFEPDRINRRDVQDLLQKVRVHTKSPIHEPLTVAAMIDPYTLSYPEKVKSKVEVILKDGKKYSIEKEDFYGFHSRPMSWESVIAKFKRLSKEYFDAIEQNQIIEVVKHLEDYSMNELIELIARTGRLAHSEKSLSYAN
jgi:2-methylcitrate dehydratase